MVWGMREPSSFGDFFPDGEFAGWDDEIKDFFDHKLSAEEKDRFGLEIRATFLARSVVNLALNE